MRGGSVRQNDTMFPQVSSYVGKLEPGVQLVPTLIDTVWGSPFSTMKWLLQKSAMAVVNTSVDIAVGQPMLSLP